MREDHEMTFGEHLEELRRRVVYALVAILLAAVLAGVFYKQVMGFVFQPVLAAWQRIEPVTPQPGPAESATGSNPTPVATAVGTSATGTSANPLAAAFPQLPPRIIIGSPFYGILAIILVTTVVGVFIASPWVAYQVWAFVGVGLRPKERRFVKVYGPASFLLFVAGGAAFYFVVLPVALRALMMPLNSVNEFLGAAVVDSSFILEDYLKFIAWMTLIFGLCFQTPLVILFLARTEIVPIETLARKQKIIIFALLIIGAFLAPGADPISCTIMGILLIMLYELGILVAWISVRRARKRKAAEDADDDRHADDDIF